MRTGRTAALLGGAALMAAGWAGSAAAFGAGVYLNPTLDGGRGCYVQILGYSGLAHVVLFDG